MFKYKDKIIETLDDFPAETFGFVYKTTHKSGKSYIGKKVLYFNRKVKLGKRELLALPLTRGRRATTKQVVKESDWKVYYGSHIEVKNIIIEEGESVFTREILHICSNKKSLSYWENKYLFSLGVIEKDEGEKYYNDNISGTFFSKDLL
mgnify:CR=1 FL=1|tara:strand:+ start:3721 stop:4167 length:447 start_codon:yes stop_codon:yes gene_type:complete